MPLWAEPRNDGVSLVTGVALLEPQVVLLVFRPILWWDAVNLNPEVLRPSRPAKVWSPAEEESMFRNVSWELTARPMNWKGVSSWDPHSLLFFVVICPGSCPGVIRQEHPLVIQSTLVPHLHLNSPLWERISSALFLDAIFDRSKGEGRKPEDGEFITKRLDHLKRD